MAAQLDETPGGPDAVARTDAPERGGVSWWQRVHWDAVAAVVVAAVLRWWWIDYARPVPVSDFAGYLATAENFLDRGFLGLHAPSAWRLPAFPSYLALGMAVSRDLLWLSAWTAALSVTQVALTYWLAWLVFQRRTAAFVAALVAAVAPPFVLFAPVLASEHLLVVLLLGALVSACKAQRTRWIPMAVLAGLLAGAAVLTRGEAVAYLLAVAFVVAVGVWRAAGARHATVPQPQFAGVTVLRALVAVGAVVVVGAVAVAVVAPWVLRNERVIGAGAGLSTTGGFNFYLAHSPGEYGWRTPLPLPLQVRNEVVRNDLGWRYGLQYVREHPEDWAPTIARGTRELLAPAEYAAFYSTVDDGDGRGTLRTRDDLRLRGVAFDVTRRSSRWLLWAGLVGLALVPVWRPRMWLAVVGIVATNWVVHAVVFWAQARYRFVVDALACVAVGAIAAALAAALSRLRDNRARRVMPASRA